MHPFTGGYIPPFYVLIYRLLRCSAALPYLLESSYDDFERGRITGLSP